MNASRFEHLDSPRNPRIRRLRKLHRARTREASGRILLEGRILVEEAMAAGLELVEVYFRRAEVEDGTLLPLLAAVSERSRARIATVSNAVLASLSTLRTPHQVVAVARRPDVPTEPVGTRIVALDGIQDPGNVGTILRSAVAFGFRTAWLGEGTPDPFHPKVLRGSAGAVFRLSSLRNEGDLAGWLADAGEKGAIVLGLSPRGGDAPHSIASDRSVIVVAGSEGEGLSPRVAAQLHHCWTLPTGGLVESLNVAAAASIALYILRVV